jgi:YVTN family beta-propeller protein
MNTTNNTLIATIPIGSGTGGLALSRDGSQLYVNFGNSTTQVAVVSTASNTVTTTLQVTCNTACSNTVSGLAITPDGSKLYVVSGTGVVTVFNTATNAQIDSISVAGSPNNFGIFIALPTNVPPPPSVPPSGTACNGVYNGTFKGNISVSAGQNCQFISGGQITGNVSSSGGNLGLNGASVGGSLGITGGTFTLTTATIAGNLSVVGIPAGNANNSVCGTQITGNLKFDQNGVSVQIGSNSPTTCPGNQISGNFEALANTASTLIFNNTVSKNLTASNNTGLLDVVSNNVGATLTCQGNTNLVMGGGNTAKKKMGQCN